MFNTTSGYSLSDIAAVTGNQKSNGSGSWGDDSWWIVLLFLFALGGWGGTGFGGAGNRASTTREEIAYGFDMNGLENSVRGVQQGLCDGFYAMNTGMLGGFSDVQSTLCQGFSGVNQAITTSGYDTLSAINANTVAGMQNTNALTAQLNAMAADNAACCCDIKSAIASGLCDVNYNLATQANATQRAICDSTRDIIESNNAGVRSILDFLTQDKIASLTAENQTLKFAASQQAQNNYLVSQLKDPCPIPAYFVPNPNCCYPQYSLPYGYNNCGCGCN